MFTKEEIGHLIWYPTFRTLMASSQTCIPLESNTSTLPKYWNDNIHWLNDNLKYQFIYKYFNVKMRCFDFDLTLTWKLQVPDLTDISSDCHWWGLPPSDDILLPAPLFEFWGRSVQLSLFFFFRILDLKLLRRRSMLRGFEPSPNDSFNQKLRRYKSWNFYA